MAIRTSLTFTITFPLVLLTTTITAPGTKPKFYKCRCCSLEPPIFLIVLTEFKSAKDNGISNPPG